MKNYCHRSFLLAVFLLFASNAVVGFQSSSISVVNTANTQESLLAHSPSIFYQSEANAAATSDVLVDLPNQNTVPQHQTSRVSGVSMPLVRAILYNQATMFLVATTVVGVMVMTLQGGDLSSLSWSGGGNLFDWNLSPLRIVEGFAGAIPLIGLGSLVEHSDHRDASHVNFATTNMVISLFGRRKTAPQDQNATSSMLVMALSLAIALSTGLSEELVFRGYLPVGLSCISQSTSIPLLLIAQAFFFSLAHISPTSSRGENKIVGGLQFLNGLWYGLIYQITGGDLVPCILAHMLHDMHVLCETWSVINNQMDYTEQAYHNKLSEQEELAIQHIKEQAGPRLNDDSLHFARRFFYAFDSQHKGNLSLHDVQRAVSYAFLKDPVVPSPEQVQETFDQVISTRKKNNNEEPRLVVSEFLRVLFALKSNNNTRMVSS